MSDNTSSNSSDNAPASPPPPSYESAPPRYGATPYAAAPQYPAATAYGEPAGYPYGSQQKTNVLAIVSLIASGVGILGFLPFIGSLAGVITGHIALSQLKTSGEKGRGLALAGTIIGWVGLALWIILGIVLILVFVVAAQDGVRYGT